MKKILVTGANGFIGRHCLEPLLGQEFEVHAVSRGVPQGPAGVVWHKLDLLKESPVSLMEQIKPTHLLHLAWITEPGAYWTSSVNLDWVQASLKLAGAFSKAGGKHLVAAGTCAEYDWNFGLCKEKETPRQPHTLYGVSKNALFEMLTSFCQGADIRFAWGRIFFQFGPFEHRRRLVSSLICSLLENKSFPCTEGGQVRDFLYSEDVAAAFCSMVDSDFSGPVNIGSGNQIQLKDLIGTISNQLGKPELVEYGALNPPQAEPSLLVPDVTILNEKLEWSPQTSLEKGIEKTIEWWKGNLNENNN